MAIQTKTYLYRAIDPESGIDLTGLLTFQEMWDYLEGSEAVRKGITWNFNVEVERQ